MFPVGINYEITQDSRDHALRLLSVYAWAMAGKMFIHLVVNNLYLIFILEICGSSTCTYFCEKRTVSVTSPLQPSCPSHLPLPLLPLPPPPPSSPSFLPLSPPLFPWRNTGKEYNNYIIIVLTWSCHCLLGP